MYVLSQQQLLLPVLLIATSSILADYCTPYTSCLFNSSRNRTNNDIKMIQQDRIRCQIWLWLAVVLSLYNNNNNKQQQNMIDEYYNYVFECWIHFILFSNIMKITMTSLLSSSSSTSSILLLKESKTTMKKSNTTTTTNTSNKIQSFINLIPLGSWFAMISTLVFVVNDDDSNSATTADDKSNNNKSKLLTIISIQVFVISIFIMSMIRWHIDRKRKLSKELRDIININDSSTIISPGGGGISSISNIDESIWYTWNIQTTLQWISSNISVVYDDSEDQDDEDERDYLISLLALHRISGSTLERLIDPTQLVQQIQFPYGPACQLAETIELKLIRKYPKPTSGMMMMGVVTTDPTRSNHPPSGRGYHHHHFEQQQRHHQQLLPSSSQQGQQEQQHQNWLELHDQQYNSQWLNQQPTIPQPPSPSPSQLPSQYHTNQQQHRQLNNYGDDDDVIPSMDNEQHQRLEKLMKEKYGLELPKFATTTTTTTETRSSSSSPFVVDSQSSSSNSSSNNILSPFNSRSEPTMLRESTVHQQPLSTTTSSSSSHHMQFPVSASTIVPTTTATNNAQTTSASSMLSSSRQTSSIQSESSSSSATNTTTTSSLFDHDPLLQSIYQQMPSHIQEIARRQPGLVERILIEKQQQQQNQNQQELYYQQQNTIHEGDDVDEEDEEEEWQQNQKEDDETTSLIQRRPRHASTSSGSHHDRHSHHHHHQFPPQQGIGRGGSSKYKSVERK